MSKHVTLSPNEAADRLAIWEERATIGIGLERQPSSALPK